MTDADPDLAAFQAEIDALETDAPMESELSRTATGPFSGGARTLLLLEYGDSAPRSVMRTGKVCSLPGGPNCRLDHQHISN